MTYAAPAAGANTQLPAGTQSMIGSYQVTGVAEFAKQMEEEGVSLSLQLLVYLLAGFDQPTVGEICAVEAQTVVGRRAGRRTVDQFLRTHAFPRGVNIPIYCCGCLLCCAGRGAPKVALRFTSGIAGVPELASAEAYVEFEKNVSER